MFGDCSPIIKRLVNTDMILHNITYSEHPLFQNGYLKVFYRVLICINNECRLLKIIQFQTNMIQDDHKRQYVYIIIDVNTFSELKLKMTSY